MVMIMRGRNLRVKGIQADEAGEEVISTSSTAVLTEEEEGSGEETTMEAAVEVATTVTSSTTKITVLERKRLGSSLSDRTTTCRRNSRTSLTLPSTSWWRVLLSMEVKKMKSRKRVKLHLLSQRPRNMIRRSTSLMEFQTQPRKRAKPRSTGMKLGRKMLKRLAIHRSNEAEGEEEEGATGEVAEAIEVATGLVEATSLAVIIEEGEEAFIELRRSIKRILSFTCDNFHCTYV